MRSLLSIAIFFLSSTIFSQVKTISADKDWSSNKVILQDTKEAEFIIRIGDIDNFDSGWPNKFDPFCDISTTSHQLPLSETSATHIGFDHILLSTNYNPGAEKHFGADRYSESYDPIKSKPQGWVLPTSDLRDRKIADAYLQLFVSDFQAPGYGSKFLFQIGDKRFVEAEKVLNNINQNDQTGKLLNIPITPEFYGMLTTRDSLTILLDEFTGAADGFAVDFMRVLINRNSLNLCKGTLKGKVLDKETGKPLTGVKVSTLSSEILETDSKGAFEIRHIPTGLELVTARDKGYEDVSRAVDVGQDINGEITIYLNKGGSTTFDGEKLRVGGTVVLEKVAFVGQKAAFKISAAKEVDKVVTFLEANPNAVIELAGHTSTGGDENFNKEFTYHRVNYVKNYIVSKGIAEDRIFAVGYGSAHSIVPNDIESDRRKNRRVEMRLMKL
jgi:outer membrane protein OmpA-like peptidoglycan-associated protein